MASPIEIGCAALPRRVGLWRSLFRRAEAGIDEDFVRPSLPLMVQNPRRVRSTHVRALRRAATSESDNARCDWSDTAQIVSRGRQSSQSSPFRTPYIPVHGHPRRSQRSFGRTNSSRIAYRASVGRCRRVRLLASVHSVGWVYESRFWSQRSPV